MSKLDWINDTAVKLEVSADEAKLSAIKQDVLKSFQPSVTAPGFRKGKVPLSKVEANINENLLNSRFLDEALNELFSEQVEEHSLRPIGQPKVEIIKFVPFTVLDFTVTVDVVGKIKLADYKKFKLKPEPVKVAKKEIEEVISSLKKRLAEKKDVKRAAKDGDEVVIDFSGKDDMGKDVAGASGKDYPLALGSNTFIKGFEPAIVGMKLAETKEFTVTFPADYAHKPLANKKVTFTVTVKSIKEVIEPELDNKFAAKAGPFKNVDELRQDIERQLHDQKLREADTAFKDQILTRLVEGSSVPVPEALLNEQINMQMDEFKQNLTYRGMTVNDYLTQAQQSEEEFINAELKPIAERKVKVGLALSEVAASEGLTVSPEEVEIRTQLLKGQYQDDSMQAQLNSAEARQDIASRLLTEKTINKLVEYVEKN